MKRALHIATAALAFVFNSNDASAQQKTISGIVTDSGGARLLGVNVVVKGTSAGTITGLGGQYVLQAPDSCTMVFSFVGFRNREVEIIGLTVTSNLLRINEVVYRNSEQDRLPSPTPKWR